MKKRCKIFSATVIFLLLNFTVMAQQFKWETKSSEARELAKRGMMHMVNIESEMAYEDFQNALKLDPDFTAAQVVLSMLSYGETKKMMAQKAKQSAGNKSAGEKLFVSILEAKDQKQRHEVWKKLLAIYPDEPFVEFSTHSTNPDSTLALAGMLAYVKKYPAKPEGYNVLGYLYLAKKDNAKARSYFEKYIQTYPTGYNPYDSMGEFYFLTGDMISSKKFYTQSLERYPFCYSSLRKMEDLKKAEAVAATKPKE